MRKFKYLFFSLSFLVGSSLSYASDNTLGKPDYAVMTKQSLHDEFSEAVMGRQHAKVKKLILAGADTNTPFQFLKSFGRGRDMEHYVQGTAFEYAVEFGDLAMIKILPTPSDKARDKALDVAIKKNYPAMTTYFLQHKAKAKDSYLIDTIDWKSTGREKEMIEILLHAKVNVNYADRFGSTALHRAVEHEKISIVKQLIAAKADINHANLLGVTPLMLAIKNHDVPMVRLLINTPKININQADKNGDTALMYAFNYIQTSYYDNSGYQKCKNSQLILKALLDTRGVDLYHANNKGKTAIQLLKELRDKLPN